MTVKNSAGRVVAGVVGFGNEIAEKMKKFLMKRNNACIKCGHGGFRCAFFRLVGFSV
jgi:hypothetical protein